MFAALQGTPAGGEERGGDAGHREGPPDERDSRVHVTIVGGAGLGGRCVLSHDWRLDAVQEVGFGN